MLAYMLHMKEIDVLCVFCSVYVRTYLLSLNPPVVFSAAMAGPREDSEEANHK